MKVYIRSDAGNQKYEYTKDDFLDAAIICLNNLANEHEEWNIIEFEYDYPNLNEVDFREPTNRKDGLLVSAYIQPVFSR